jgi:hypothetical protein
LYEKIGGYDGKMVGHYFTSSESKKELGNLFIFMAKNTSVEWTFDGYNKDGNVYYTLGTRHHEEKGAAIMSKNNEEFQTYHIHSHPGSHDYTAIASSGDLDNAWSLDKVFRETYKKTVPKSYVYHPYSNKLVEYDSKNSSKRVEMVKKYSDLP